MTQNPTNPNNPETMTIVKHERNDALIFPQTMDELFRLAKILVSSGLLPIFINTPEKAATIILKGRELNIPPMEALNNINVIQGKPTLGCHLIAALILRAGGRYQVLEKSEKRCRIRFIRDEIEHIEEYTFEKAQKMGLTGKDNWKRMPANMLYARCMSEGGRTVFPDALGGIYTTEEMNPDVKVKFTESGEQVFEGVTIDADTGEVKEQSQPQPDKESDFITGDDIATAEILADPKNQPPPKPEPTPTTKKSAPIAKVLRPAQSKKRIEARHKLIATCENKEGKFDEQKAGELWLEYKEFMGYEEGLLTDLDDDDYTHFVEWVLSKKEQQEKVEA